MATIIHDVIVKPQSMCDSDEEAFEVWAYEQSQNDDPNRILGKIDNVTDYQLPQILRLLDAVEMAARRV